jgi:hypothetical protein
MEEEEKVEGKSRKQPAGADQEEEVEKETKAPKEIQGMALEEAPPLFDLGGEEIPKDLPDETWPLEKLIDALESDRHPLVRSNAIVSLGRIGGPEVIDPMIKALGDVDVMVKSNAMMMLATFGDAIFDRMISALEDPDGDIRAGAAFVLGELQDERAIEPLKKLLKDESVMARVQAKASLLAFEAMKGKENK